MYERLTNKVQGFESLKEKIFKFCELDLIQQKEVRMWETFLYILKFISYK